MSRLELILILRPVEFAAAGLNLALHDAAKQAEDYGAQMHRGRRRSAIAASTRRSAA